MDYERGCINAGFSDHLVSGKVSFGGNEKA